MDTLNRETIANALKTIRLNNHDSNIMDAGIISTIVINDGHVAFSINAPYAQQHDNEALRQTCEKLVSNLAGVNKTTIMLTSERPMSPPSKNSSPPDPKPIKGVKHIIAVASGKGGVGKSTISVALAQALAHANYNVGLVDADIYGPSIPSLLDIQQEPKIDDNQRMVPIEKNGIRSISMGYLVDPNKATVWRGSMATKALYQLLVGTDWNDTDFLVIDLPPGTGDIQLSLGKQFKIDQAVLVTTAQTLAIADVKKAAYMFDKLNIPVLGIVENMSYFQTSKEGSEKHYLFGKDGGKELAETLNARFLGEVPLIGQVTSPADHGISKHPIVSSEALGYTVDLLNDIYEGVS